MRSAEIREKFLRFFEENGHTRVKSSSLIPAADPTLLFTNAGMVQFKDCFLGLKDPGYRRATSSQKCVRAGGKHNDLENVGFTPRHHTFFEMLGNFSFGDYFKKEAIAFAWELLTEVYRLPKDRLRITVYEKDDEAMELWKAQGVRPDWIYRLGEKDNFWAMGDTGPCGPCTEIHYDWGKEYSCKRKDCETPECPCGLRFLEIWNLVFMQYNRDASGKLTPLPKPSVDTGSGLERMAAVLQRQYSNYDTDLFDPIKSLLSRLTHRAYGDNPDTDASMRVIFDHIRATTFLVADGVTPSNEGRGYVLRRILRRAIRHGKKLDQNAPFLFQLVPAVVQSLGGFYPEIKESQLLIEEIIREEEKKFHETLHRGIGLLDESIAALKAKNQAVLPGEIAFKLYDTFGFPLDLTQVICREHKMTVDEAGFALKMEAQRTKSGATLTEERAKLDPGKLDALRKKAGVPPTRFRGYETTKGSGKLLLLLNADGTEALDLLPAGSPGLAVFDETPFYPEGGGQVGDTGLMGTDGVRATVRDAIKVADVTYHVIFVDAGTLRKGGAYDLEVDSERRQATAINHTATHLLHAALRALPEIGPRVKQAGSLVTPELLRFDFTCPRGLTEDEIAQVEQSVNEEIQRKDSVTIREMKFDEAVKSGALAFFDEKYGDRVRVIRVGSDDEPFSVELCGGTHLSNTAEVGVFKIVSESSIASGTRRIIAYTGPGARKYLLDRSRAVDKVTSLLKVPEDRLLEKIEGLVRENKKLKSDLEAEKIRSAQGGARGNGGGSALWDKSKKVGGVQLVTELVEGASPKILRSLVDQVRDKLKQRVVVALASQSDGKVQLCVGITKDLLGELDAGKLVKAIAPEVEGSGGGKPDFAQAGGNRPDGLSSAFAKLEGLLRDHES